MQYTAHITFVSGDTHKENPVTKDTLGSVINRLCEGPSAKMGIIKSVLIVDAFDTVCIEIEGDTIIYPPELKEKQQQWRSKHG